MRGEEKWSWRLGWSRKGRGWVGGVRGSEAEVETKEEEDKNKIGKV